MSFLQLRVDIGIEDHVWQEKHDAIAMTVNSLDDEFKPAMRAGWLAYISKTYPDGAAAAVDAIGEGTLVLDDDWVKHVLISYAHLSPVLGCKLASFLQ